MPRLLILFLMAGCATRTNGPGPTAAVRGWLAAVEHDDPRAAYPLLSQSVRRSIPQDEFARRWRASTEERHAQATALGPLVGRAPTERARALWSDGRSAELVREPGGWRLAAPRVYASGAASPEDAVRQFADALEHHDLDGLLENLADPLRSLVERELADRLQRAKSATHKEIQLDGNRARIRVDDRYYLELKREDGRWRVSDFN